MNFSEESENREQELELTHPKFEYMAKKILQNIGGTENLVFLMVMKDSQAKTYKKCPPLVKEDTSFGPLSGLLNCRSMVEVSESHPTTIFFN